MKWDDTAIQTQNSKFKPWRSEAEYLVMEALHNTENVEGVEHDTWRCERFVVIISSHVGIDYVTPVQEIRRV